MRVLAWAVAGATVGVVGFLIYVGLSLVRHFKNTGSEIGAVSYSVWSVVCAALIGAALAVGIAIILSRRHIGAP